MSPAARYAAVLARDARCDGAFVFAVKTTGVYCRPSCPARRPLRANTRFFTTCVAAEAAGFRPCRRCAPQAVAEDLKVTVVRTLCDELRARPDRRVSWPALARRAGYSVSHLKRLFDEVLGLSPARFVEACRAEALRHELKGTGSVAAAIYAAGYTAPSQVYGSPSLGMPPGAFARGGEGHLVRYTTGETRFGRLLLAGTDRGVCAVELGDDDAELELALAHSFPRATLERAADSEALRRWFTALEDHLAGRRPHPDLPLDVRTTAFRHRVYRALQAIPRGETRTYAEVARAIGRPTAARAVARACATNSVAILIPCHRVLRGDGQLAGYRWGVERKRGLLEAEARRAS
jgi:AraC family transcriptional regulator, regulatory protein of adaptative response / methylated-DNA-[protein]-cysteine methyltransferase